MQFSAFDSNFKSIQLELDDSLIKAESGKLNSKEYSEIEKQVNQFKDTVLVGGVFEGSENISEKLNVNAKFEQLESRMMAIREKHLATMLNIFRESVKTGTISFGSLQQNPIPWEEKITEILTHAPKNINYQPELQITDIPGKSKDGLQGTMKLVVKEAPIYDQDKVIQSQIIDPIYRSELLKHEDQKHYGFEFFDSARSKEIEEKKRVLGTEEKILGDVQGLLQDFFSEEDIEVFNNGFSPEHKKYFGVQENQELEHQEVYDLFQSWQEKSHDFPINKESVLSEFEKATINGRLSANGEVGELKSVNIHSDLLGGTELMDVWDKFCSFMSPKNVYLEDDAKIEGKTGSYNLRLFRLIGLNGKSSWYLDGYNYVPYKKNESHQVVNVENAREKAIEKATFFKSLTLGNIEQDFESQGMQPSGEVREALQRYSLDPSFGKDITLFDTVKALGGRVMKDKEPLHKDLHSLLSGVLEAYKGYSGGDSRIENLKSHAESLLNDRFYRKNYS